jgi:putative ABC transport system permease protein
MKLPYAARLYRTLLWLLPPPVRRDDGEEMLLAFTDLWMHAGGVGRRVALGVRLFGRLPIVVALEWTDLLGFTGRGSTGGWEMTGWVRNLRLAVRTLLKSPVFTVTSVLLIGLGVGAVTTMFTVVDHVLLRPLPYPAADRLITVENGAHSAISFREFEKQDGVEQWAAGSVQSANLIGEGDPIRIEWANVSEHFFSLFGASPRQGRLFVAEDFSAPDVVVVTGPAWRALFGEDPGLVGRTVRVDGEPYTVVGILDDAFEAPSSIIPADAAMYRPIDWATEDMQSAGYHALWVSGRMAPGVTLTDLQPRFDALADRLAVEYPDEMTNREGEHEPMPVAGLQASSVERVRNGLNLLLGAVALLLLVACLNVAHLFLARGLGRVQEMAVRRALGAGAGGLLQQLLAESLVIGAAGYAAGLGLAWVGLEAMMALNPSALPRAETVSLDLRVAAFAGLLSAVTAVLFGLVPALRTIGSDLTNELKASSRSSTSGRGSQRLRSALVVAEVALSLVLVAQAGLLFKSFMQVQAHDTGFVSEGVWTIPLTPTGVDTPEDYEHAMDAVLGSLAALPGVESAAYGLTQPFEFTGRGRCCWSNGGVAVDGEANESLRVRLHPVSEAYFATLGVELRAGSVWTQSSELERPVPVVITERLAVDLFGSASGALGHVLGAEGRLQMSVTGVAPDIKHNGLDQPDQLGAYLPISVMPFAMPMAHMAVKLRGDAPTGLARTLREAVWQAAPDIPVPTVRSMDDWVSASLTGRRFDSAVYGAFGAVALLLAAAGLYGTLLYNVRQRRREIGIRMALGAAQSRVERQVVGSGLRLAALGTVAGVAGALWVGRRMEERLYQVQGTDPVALGGAAVALLLVAALASWLPARRAGRTDALETLKAE